jgi:hypothetical protein
MMKSRQFLAAIFVALLLGILSGAPAYPKKPRPAPCAGGRFLVAAGAAPLLSSVLAENAAIVIDGAPQIDLGTCGPSSARRKATSKFTLLKAKWNQCANVAKVKVVAKISAPECLTLDGTIRAKKTKAQHFTATRSTCDDGVVDSAAGEECDVGFPCAGGAACANCTCPPDDSTTTTTHPVTSTTATTFPLPARPFALPEDWVVTRDSGYVVEARDPESRAFVRLLFPHFRTRGSGPASARAFVEYWHDFILGDVFPVDARGEQLSETEVGNGKVGGPYLRYEFEDAQRATRYVQVYASAGGISSIVLTGWAKSADFPAAQATLEAILDSAELPGTP